MIPQNQSNPIYHFTDLISYQQKLGYWCDTRVFFYKNDDVDKSSCYVVALASHHHHLLYQYPVSMYPYLVLRSMYACMECFCEILCWCGDYLNKNDKTYVSHLVTSPPRVGLITKLAFWRTWNIKKHYLLFYSEKKKL